MFLLLSAYQGTSRDKKSCKISWTPLRNLETFYLCGKHHTKDIVLKAIFCDKSEKAFSRFKKSLCRSYCANYCLVTRHYHFIS